MGAVPVRRDSISGRDRILWIVLLALVGCSGLCRSEDWPTYRHDVRRSGISAEQLVFPLSRRQMWVVKSGEEPPPSLLGPAAHRDYWHGLGNLVPKATHDRAFHVSIAGDRVYVGSFVSDKVFCLDAATGKIVWDFFTEGPVRNAPTLADGKVYFGSDDGRAYCLDAVSGEMEWAYNPAGQDRRLWGDGRMISRWPVRTGVLVDRGTAYFCSGLFPNESVYLCAVDADTGTVSGMDTWKKEISIAPQGYMLATPTLLYVPTSRTSPVLFRRSEGNLVGAFPGKGGTFALLAEESFYYGPNLQGTVDQYPSQPGSRIASFQGLQMVVSGQVSYLVSERATMALNRETQDVIWTTPTRFPYCLILVGDALFAGGLNELAALDRATGEVIWTAPVSGKVYGLAAANGRLFVSTDKGHVYGFSDAETDQNGSHSAAIALF